MEDSAIRYLDMGRRVTDFTGAYTASFPAGSHASGLIAAIVAAVEMMETQGAKQENAERNGKDATDRKDAARATLLELMRAINRTARGMKKVFPDIGNQFAMPRTYGDQVIINTARSFVTSATPIAAEFTGRGLPADFLSAFDTAINNFENAIDTQDTALGEQTAATAAINDAQRQLIDAVSEFNPIVLNTFSKDPSALAAWRSASHVERAPKRAAKKKPPAS
jgi:hypothetical protein